MTTANIDRDSITTEAKHVRDSNGGSLYRIGSINMVVLNGTYKEMGLQYGDLAKDKLLATRDFWKKIFIDSGKLSYESIHAAIGGPFYTSATKTRKDFYDGIADASGISTEEAVVLDNWVMLVVLGRRAGCSSMSFWGSKTTDGTAYMGRNLDFPDFARNLIAANGIITVLNPVGGDLSIAAIGIPGTVSGFSDFMNSEGLYIEYNNGLGSIEPVLYSNRFSFPVFMAEMMHKFSSIEEFKVVFNSNKSDYPCILGVSEPNQGAHFEISPDMYTVDAGDEESLRCNQFHNPAWGIPQLPGATGWYSMTREESWRNAIAAAVKGGKVDEKVIMEAMNAPMFNDDGTLTETGFSVFEPANDPSAGGGGESGDVTMYQLITHAAERKWWFRIPTHTGWLEIDLKKYFNQ